MPPDLHPITAASVAPLSLGTYRAVFRVDAPIRLPAYTGSLWHGVLGHALQDVFCSTRTFQCHACDRRRSCCYGQLMETAPDPNGTFMPDQKTAPRPMVLRIPEPGHPSNHQVGELVPLDLTLFGEANNRISDLVAGLIAMDKRPFGRQKGRLVLERFERQDPSRPDGPTSPLYQAGRFANLGLQAPPILPKPPRWVTIKLVTPLRLMQKGRLVNAAKLDFPLFFRALVRRVVMMFSFHGTSELEADYARLWVLAAETRFSGCRTFPYHWERYSNRQNRTMRMDGLLGTMRLDLRGKEELWPLLWWGQHLLMGKSTVMGMGRFKLE